MGLHQLDVFVMLFVGYVIELTRMLSQLPTLASKFAFVNEYSNGPSSGDLAKFNVLKSTNFKLPVPPKISGDLSGGISFSNIV